MILKCILSAAAVWASITFFITLKSRFLGFVYILSDRGLWKAFGGANIFLLWSQTDQSVTASVPGPRPQQPITMGPRALTGYHDQSGRGMRAVWEREEEGRGLSLWNQYYSIERKNTKSSHSVTFSITPYRLINKVRVWITLNIYHNPIILNELK